MVTGCLKYLLAAAGIGFLYVRRDLIGQLEPTVTGWFGRVNPFAFRIDELDWPSGASRFESGTPPVPNAYAALSALDLLDRVGYDEIARQVDHLTARYVDAARSHGFLVRTPSAPMCRGPLVVVQSVDGPELVSKLAARGIVASCRGNGVRVSFHAYNTDADVDAVVSALAAESRWLER
jgi:selenocysteine lyase/cysteine desulfurase